MTRDALAASHGAALAGQLQSEAADEELGVNARAIRHALAAICRGDTDVAHATLDGLHPTHAFELDLLLTGR